MSYPASGDYAIIGNCRAAALISRGRGQDWLCLPRFDAPALFAAVLDRRRGGSFVEEAEAFLAWMLHATRLTWPELQILYDVHGRTRLREHELTHLEGYAAARLVRIARSRADADPGASRLSGAERRPPHAADGAARACDLRS